MDNIYLLFIAGGVGALIKEILADNCIKLPRIYDGLLDLGFLGAVAIGGFVGYVVDGSYLTAMMGGFVGFSAIQNLVPKNIVEVVAKDLTVEEQIRKIAKEELVDPDLAVRVAKCESSLNPKAININAPDSIDRGVFQINSKWHPDVTEAQAYDVEFSARFFCKAFKEGHLEWWNASKKCWAIDK